MQSNKPQNTSNPSDQLPTNKTPFASPTPTSTPTTKPQPSITTHPTQSKPSVSNPITSNVFLPSRQTDSCQIYHNPLIFIILSRSNKLSQLLLLMINSHRLGLIIAIPLKLATVKKYGLGWKKEEKRAWFAGLMIWAASAVRTWPMSFGRAEKSCACLLLPSSNCRAKERSGGTVCNDRLFLIYIESE